ncbi:MAG: hypothetical protein RQ715_07005 [Methylococcales bacterium]|nr:hypothetical protein [Methylococcales bacterium]
MAKQIAMKSYNILLTLLLLLSLISSIWVNSSGERGSLFNQRYASVDMRLLGQQLLEHNSHNYATIKHLSLLSSAFEQAPTSDSQDDQYLLEYPPFRLRQRVRLDPVSPHNKVTTNKTKNEINQSRQGEMVGTLPSPVNDILTELESSENSEAASPPWWQAYTINMVYLTPGLYYAVVNGRLVTEGARLGHGVRVNKIELSHVILKKGSLSHTFKLKDEPA